MRHSKKKKPKTLVMYDSCNMRLVCYGDEPNPSFWDSHWSDAEILRTYRSMSRVNSIVRTTQKYLKPEDGPILEGGCGMGQFVYCLTQAGYDCVGVDTARKTIERIKEVAPELAVSVMDIKSLDFPDGFFSGYWSLGIIEHFYEGYDQIVKEMCRVLKPGGYLFVSVPAMSIFRRLKAYFGAYMVKPKSATREFNGAQFYQFIFSPKAIIKDFLRNNFSLISQHNKGGLKGLSDEVAMTALLVRALTSLRSKGFAGKGIVKLLDLLVSPFVGHTCFFVLQKQKD